MVLTGEEVAEVPAAGSRRPPVGLIAAAAGVLAVATVLLFLGEQLWLHALGYVLSTFILIGLVARYRWTVVRLRADRAYAHNPALDRLGTALVVAGIVVAALHVWPIATELSR